MNSKCTSKIVGLRGWHIFYGLFLGWIGGAGARETWRDYILIGGFAMFTIMTVVEEVHSRRAAKHTDSTGVF